MPLRKLLPVPGLGLGTTFQALPFQCSIRFMSWPGPENVPAAQALQGEITVTLVNVLVSVPGLRGGEPARFWQLAAAAGVAAVAAVAPAEPIPSPKSRQHQPGGCCPCHVPGWPPER